MDVIAICLVVTAIFAYLNHRFLGLPSVIGLMTIALVLSLLVNLSGSLGFGLLRGRIASLVQSLDFSAVLLQGMLSLMLFAGALHLDLRQLRRYRWQVAILAFAGTALSTAADVPAGGVRGSSDLRLF